MPNTLESYIEHVLHDDEICVMNILAEHCYLVSDNAFRAEDVGNTGEVVAWLKIYGRGVYTRERERLKRNGVSSFWLYAQAGPFMCRWSRLLGQLRSGEYHRLHVAAEDWFKAIDDLGTDALGADGEATQFAVSKMGDLLDRRLRKWTVITTNFSRKQIAEKFDVRIASRLMRHGSVIVDATGLRDYGLRLEAAKEAA